MRCSSSTAVALGISGCSRSSGRYSVRLAAIGWLLYGGADHTRDQRCNTIGCSRYDRYPASVRRTSCVRLTRSKHNARSRNPTVPFRPVGDEPDTRSTVGDVSAADDSTADVLGQAAFGTGFGDALPASTTALDAWHRAVALGARGYYSRARAELRRARVLGASAALASLVTSTEASFVRQLGDHRAAARLDGVALIAATDPASAADALTGLAADALGIGRLMLADRLLQRAAAVVHDSDHLSSSSQPVSSITEIPSATGDSELWRQLVRLDWVTAELAMAGGKSERAGEFARSASVRAQASGSVRHVVKSRLIVAASHCVAGELDEALKNADDVQRQCDRLDLLPLRWAAAMLCDGVRAESADAATIHECEREIERRGGEFRKTPVLPGGVGTGS